MTDRQTEMLDVTVVLKAEYAEKIPASVSQLKTLGMNVENVDSNNGVIEGTVIADKLPEIRKLDCVAYARVDFEFTSEFAADEGEADDPGHNQQD